MNGFIQKSWGCVWLTCTLHFHLLLYSQLAVYEGHVLQVGLSFSVGGTISLAVSRTHQTFPFLPLSSRTVAGGRVLTVK